MKFRIRAYKLNITTKDGKSIELDGTKDDHLRIRFNITHYIGGVVSQASIDIFNLSKQSEGIASSDFAKVSLQAGYRGNIGLIFSGQSINYEFRREGPDSFVRLYATSGIQDFTGKMVKPKSYAKNISMLEVLKYVVETLDYPYVIQDEDKLPIAPTGYQVSGTVIQEIKRITLAYGLEYYCENGKLIIKSSESPVRKKVIQISELDNGLIGTPILNTAGIEFDLHLNPGIRLNTRVNLKAKAARIQFSGAYTATNKDLISRGEHLVKKITFNGDTHENSWITRCYAIKPAAKKDKKTKEGDD